MVSARVVAAGLSAASAAAMLYVGLYQVRAVKILICPLFGGCQAVADAPFARPFGVPDGFIAAALYGAILVLELAPAPRAPWLEPLLLALGGIAAIGNLLGVLDMIRLGSFCFYCLLTMVLSPFLLWAIWASR